ncbi:MAG: recombinase family protein [Negativicutes bacterium]
MDKKYDIKHVAIYLRKSRDEGEYEDVLSKHRDTLVAYAEKQKWTYRLYEEIGSGENIVKRKKMQQLLVDVKDNRYDGVLVMDIDRLGRGERDDWNEICKTLLGTETYIVTRQKIYDLSNEQDQMLLEFETIFSRMEYKIIISRFKTGKVAGAMKGMWTNGRPPYPYVYNQDVRQVEVDADKQKIYRLIIDKYLLGHSTQEIAIWLNRKNVAPPYSGKRNKYGWSNNTVYRLVTSEIHLGYIIYGKTRSRRGVSQVVEKQDWIKVKGEHEALKTEEEHEQILAKIAQNTIMHRKSRVGMLPLSGLLYCSKCGRRMQFKRKETKTGTYWSALCVYTYPDGTKCDQVGRKLDDAFYKTLYQKITKIDEQTMELVDETNEQYREIETLLTMKQKELVQTEKAIEKILDLYEDGMITKQRFSDRMSGHEKVKNELEADIEQCKLALASQVNMVTVETVQKRIDEFKALWSDATDPSEQNRAYRLLIDKIAYNREDNGVTLEVLYK